MKKKYNDLVIFGGDPLFNVIRSTSNLTKPNIDVFLGYLKKSFENKQLTDNGQLVKELEIKLAQLHQTKNCVTFCNGLWGIVLTVKKLALPGKTEVVMPSMTYRRLADIVAWIPLIPRFCDIDRQILGPSVSMVESCINDNTALIFIAQPIVNICDMEGFEKLSKKHKIPILFDSCEAGPASYKSKKIGSFGNAECFSMHASKLLNAFEAGYVTTNDDELADSLKKMRAYGLAEKGELVEFGINAKLNEIHAAMALASLEGLDRQVNHNKNIHQIYKEKLREIQGIDMVEYDKTEIRGYKNILVKLNDDWPFSRENTIKILNLEKMLVIPYYFPPLHMKKTEYETIFDKLPVAEELSQKYLLLPSGEFMSDKDVIKITNLLKFLLKNSKKINRELKNILI